MITPNRFVDELARRGIVRFTGVPCSFFQAAINCVIDDPRLSYTIAPNEGSALAIAAGDYLSGGQTAVMIQNSGLGNLVNPLTSLNMIYRIPALLFISGRAYGVADEPQHEIIGGAMGPVLDAMGVRRMDMPDNAEAFGQALDEALGYMRSERLPFVFLVRKGTLDEYTPDRAAAAVYPMKRIDAIRALSAFFEPADRVVATTGKPSRELFAVRDRPGNFYMQGSMGHAASIGLGLAQSDPSRRVIVLDGDGAVLMHMGILSTVGHYRPANFFHIVLDNESYETTGDQDTTSSTTDLAAIALAAGYRETSQVTDRPGLEAAMARLRTAEGPILLRVKINRLPTTDIPRISSKYSSRQITDHFLSTWQKASRS